MDMDTAGNRNMNKKEAERFENTKNTAYAVYENEVMPVIIVVTGTILKSFRKYLKNINGKNDIKVLQKKVTRGAAYMLT